jgi:hypothetical protein
VVACCRVAAARIADLIIGLFFATSTGSPAFSLAPRIYSKVTSFQVSGAARRGWHQAAAGDRVFGPSFQSHDQGRRIAGNVMLVYGSRPSRGGPPLLRREPRSDSIGAAATLPPGGRPTHRSQVFMPCIASEARGH